MGRVLGNLQEKIKASEWVFDRVKEALDLVAHDEARTVSVVQEIMLKSTLSAAYHRTSRRTGWCHKVLPVPELQQFPPGRQRLVGLCWKEVHQLVVCDL